MTLYQFDTLAAWMEREAFDRCPFTVTFIGGGGVPFLDNWKVRCNFLDCHQKSSFVHFRKLKTETDQ